MAATGQLLWDSDVVATTGFVGQGYEPKLATGNFSNDFSYDATNRVLSLTNPPSTPLVLRVNGQTQQNVTTIDFESRESSLVGGKLSIGRLTGYDKLPLTSPNGTLNLEASNASTLVWNGDELATRQWTGLNYQGLLTQNNFEPGLAWNNTTQKLSLSGVESRSALKLTDPNSNVYELQINNSGQLERHDPTSVPSLRRNYDSEIAGKQASFSASRPLNFTTSQTGQPILESLWKELGSLFLMMKREKELFSSMLNSLLEELKSFQISSKQIIL